MAKQRQISDRFWYDTYVAEELTEPDEKLLFIYLLTNQYINITGIYEIAIRTMNFDTNIPAPRIREILKKLSDANKIHYESGYVILENYHKHVSYNNPSVKKYVREQIQNLPMTISTKHTNIIKHILDLAMPTPCPRGKQETTTKPATSQQNNAHPMPTPYPPHGQPSNPNPNPNPIANANTNPTPLPPKGERPLQNQDGTREMGGFVQHPDGRVERKDNNPSKEKGWRKDATRYGQGIWLTDEEFKKLKDEFGDDAAIDIPDAVGVWATEKKIDVKDPYKMCRQFAQKAQKAVNNG